MLISSIFVIVCVYIFLQLHVADCPDRAGYDRYKYNIDAGRVVRPEPVQARVDYASLESEDNWDDVRQNIFKTLL